MMARESAVMVSASRKGALARLMNRDERFSGLSRDMVYTVADRLEDRAAGIKQGDSVA